MGMCMWLAQVLKCACSRGLQDDPVDNAVHAALRPDPQDKAVADVGGFPETLDEAIKGGLGLSRQAVAGLKLLLLLAALVESGPASLLQKHQGVQCEGGAG